MVASVASCLQKIGFASFSVVTELLPAQGHVFRKSMLTDTVFRKLPLCLNLFCSQHVSRAELSSLPPLTGLVYRSFYWATWPARRHRARLQPWSNAFKDTVQTPAFHTSPLTWHSLAVRPAAIRPREENRPSTLIIPPLAVDCVDWSPKRGLCEMFV